ncbi:lipopolysaccharide biosynthesis protein [Vibrio sp. C8]
MIEALLYFKNGINKLFGLLLMAIINFIKRKFNKTSDFNKSFGKLLSTSVILGLFSAICIPIIASIYNPEHIGKFQLYLSIVLVFSSVSSFKYEMAQVLPKRKYQSRTVFQLSLCVLFFSTTIYSLVFYFFSSNLLAYFNAYELENYISVVPVGIFISGLYQLTQMYIVSTGDFSKVSINRSVQAISNNGFSIGLGGFYPSFSSLIICNIGSFILPSCLSLIHINRHFKLNEYNLSLMSRYAKKYKKFPMVNTPNVFLNTLSMNLPVFILSKHYSFELVGVYVIANKILDMPITLISGSLNQVYTKFAADEYNKSPEKLKLRYINTVKKLFFIATSIVMLVFIGTEFVLPYIITSNSQWSDLSIILLIMVFPKVSQLINNPLSTTFMIINKQEVATIIIVLFMLLRYFSLTLDFDFRNTLILYAISTTVYYLTFNFIQYRLIK